jgi:hypothetical protein
MTGDVGGACIVATSGRAINASWCDFPTSSTTDRAEFTILLRSAAFWNPSPAAADANCEALYDDMFLQYCGMGSPNPFGAMHTSRMDRVFGYAANVNADGTFGQLNPLVHAPRTCGPPP